MCKASGADGEGEPPPTTTSLISLLATVLAFERCGDGVTNRALVKEETIPRSGGPLDSDLLIRQALSRPPSPPPLPSALPPSLPPSRSCLGLLLVCSRLWVEVTARRGKYSEGLSKPEASSHQRTGENTPKQPAGWKQANAELVSKDESETRLQMITASGKQPSKRRELHQLLLHSC